MWVERQSEFSGAFQIKLSATALSQLMCSDHAALDQIQARSPPRCSRLKTNPPPNQAFPLAP